MFDPSMVEALAVERSLETNVTMSTLPSWGRCEAENGAPRWTLARQAIVHQNYVPHYHFNAIRAAKELNPTSLCIINRARIFFYVLQDKRSQPRVDNDPTYLAIMAGAPVDIDHLSQSQQEALQQYTSVTDQGVEEAIPLLQRSQWNVQV